MKGEVMNMLNIHEICKIIPHRYPFLLIDRIIEVEAGKRAVGIKNITANEWFFGQADTDNLVVPEAVIIEAMAQTACVTGLIQEENRGKKGIFTGIEAMDFMKEVIPGDTLTLETDVYFCARGIYKSKAIAYVEGQTVAEGKISFFIMD